MSRVRWLLVAQDGWGLGHVSRMIGLARALRRHQPDADILLLTRSEAAHLVWREGFSSLKLPSYERGADDGARLLSRDSHRRLVAGVVHACVDEYQPHGVVIDTFPAGVFQELAPFLDAPAHRFFVARENRFLARPGDQAALARYERIFAPYRPGEIELALPDGVPVEWVGPILVRSTDEALPRAEARARLGLPADGEVCLVAFGGGGNPRYAELEAWVADLAARFPRWTFAFATPPLLEVAPEHPGARNVRRVSYYPIAECLDAFDAAISAAGSSAYELAHWGVPSILVPDANRLSDEDFDAKARRVLGERGGFVVGCGDARALGEAFAALDDPAVRSDAARALLERPGGDGARAAARSMIAAMEGGSAPDA